MTPSVGRAVHYVSYGTPNGEYDAVCRAATITEVHSIDGWVALCVMNPTGLFFPASIPHDETKDSGSWHWPERVD